MVCDKKLVGNTKKKKNNKPCFIVNVKIVFFFFKLNDLLFSKPEKDSSTIF